VISMPDWPRGLAAQGEPRSLRLFSTVYAVALVFGELGLVERIHVRQPALR